MNLTAYHAILKRLGVESADQPAHLLTMPLSVFEREGQPLEIRVPWWPEATLWFVPDARHAEALAQEGIARGRIWTASELLSLFVGPNLTADAPRIVGLVKVEFDGEVVGVHPGQAR